MKVPTYNSLGRQNERQLQQQASLILELKEQVGRLKQTLPASSVPVKDLERLLDTIQTLFTQTLASMITAAAESHVVAQATRDHCLGHDLTGNEHMRLCTSGMQWNGASYTMQPQPPTQRAPTVAPSTVPVDPQTIARQNINLVLDHLNKASIDRSKAKEHPSATGRPRSKRSKRHGRKTL